MAVAATAPATGRPWPSSGLVTGGVLRVRRDDTAACKRRAVAMLYLFGN